MKILLLILTLGLYTYAGSIVLPENFKATFIQTITNTKAKEKTIKYSGKVRFSNKTLLKWEYLEPKKKEVCTDGKELLVVEHDLEQVSNYLINDGFDLAKVLEKAKQYSPNVYVAKHDDKNYTIKLDSKQRIHSIAYFDAFDNKVQILFKKMKYGKGKLKLKSMKCNYPQDYDFIRG